MSTEQIVFGPFRFDPVALQLWRAEQAVAVQPKPLAVLRALTARPGQVVSKRELLTAVWAGTYVTQAVLKVAVRALREALGESAEAPQYVATVGREGYRFLAEGGRAQEAQEPRAPGNQLSPAPLMVGREAELAHLHRLLGKALRGEPQLVFVTGEPGIGKTTLVETFLAEVGAAVRGRPLPGQPYSGAPTQRVTIAHGQCIEQYGGGEAYLPILEALGRLCRDAEGEQIIPLLRRYAPTWLGQLSGVLTEAEAQALRLQVQGATQQRMLREMAEALEQITTHQPLLLVLEDLHWSDQATVEFLAYLAQRQARACLFVMGTYCPADVVLAHHSLKAVKHELQAKRQCEELCVELLSQQAIHDYLSRRFPRHQFPPELAREIHQRTDGNALFLVNVVEELLQQGRIVEEQHQWTLTGDVTQVSVPDTLRQLIEKQIQQRSEGEQRVLEIASVAGTEFAVAAVAAALKRASDEVEEVCEALAWQGHFVEERGIAEWPDGALSGRYGFRHALYQSVLYDRMAEARKIRAHRLLGERLEAGYGARAAEVAAELAMHFEQGRDYRRAVQYCEHAGKNALQRSAHREAIAHLTKGLELLKTLPDTPERARQELILQLTLGAPLMATKGWGAPEVGAVYTRTQELCQQIRETPLLFQTLEGLWLFHFNRGEFQTAHGLAEQLLGLAQRQHDLAFLMGAHSALGTTLFRLGALVPAQEHLEQSIALSDPQKSNPYTFSFAYDPRIGSLSYTVWNLWVLGYMDRALKRGYETLTLAQELSHPFRLAFALSYVVRVHQLRREVQTTREQAEALIGLCAEQGFAIVAEMGRILKGWALVEQGQKEGIGQMQQGIAAWWATGTEATLPSFLGLLVESCGQVGRTEEGLVAVDKALALVDKTGERFWEAELYRLKGELLLAQEGSRLQALGFREKAEEAEAYFLKAIEIARRQQAKSLELRAVMSLSRLWRRQRKKQKARQMLAEIYGWFTEGLDTGDLQEAKALLEELGSP